MSEHQGKRNNSAVNLSAAYLLLCCSVVTGINAQCAWVT